MLILFFFSTNGAIAHNCDLCGTGNWTTKVFTVNKNCTVEPKSVCNFEIEFKYRKANCNPTAQLQFQILKISYAPTCFAQNPCYDIDLLSEAIYWTVDMLYQMADPTSSMHDISLLGFITLPDKCLRNVESFSTGCFETIKVSSPFISGPNSYTYQMRPCFGEACCRVGYVMCPVNVHGQNQYRDLWRRNNSSYFSNNCFNLTSPFGDVSSSNIIESSGCVPACESFTVFPVIQD